MNAPKPISLRQKTALTLLLDAKREHDTGGGSEWRSASELGQDIQMNTLYSLVARGLAEHRNPPGSIFSPRNFVEWRLKP